MNDLGKKMSDDVLIKVDGVSKKFCRSLKRSLYYGLQDIGSEILGKNGKHDKLRKDEFWAVQDVSFELRRGECLGLIGRNGAGKTTLLKMLNGIIKPDTGLITICGRVGALIALGSGFNPILSGRENIYVNGSILGLSKKEIASKIDEIIDFAEIGEFIDSPVQNYSSGMSVRLGFAIAINMAPSILLIDEVLAVGDSKFRVKCYQKLHELKKNGITIILVAHNEYTIREQTQKCVYLKNGKVKFIGSSEDGITRYLKDILEKKIERSEIYAHNNISKHTIDAELKFFDQDYNEIDYLESGKQIILVIKCHLTNFLEPIVSVNFYSENGFFYCINSQYENISLEEASGNKSNIIITIPQFHLPVDSYTCSLTISDSSNANVIEWQEKRYHLIVGRPHNARGGLKLPTSWKIEKRTI